MSTLNFEVKPYPEMWAELEMDGPQMKNKRDRTLWLEEVQDCKAKIEEACDSYETCELKGRYCC